MTCCGGYMWAIIGIILVLASCSEKFKYYFKFTVYIITCMLSATLPIPLMLFKPRDARNALYVNNFNLHILLLNTMHIPLSKSEISLKITEELRNHNRIAISINVSGITHARTAKRYRYGRIKTLYN